MHLRSITPEDIPKIAEIHLKAWQTTYKDLLPPIFLSTLSETAFAGTWYNRLKGNPPAGFNILAEAQPQGIVGFASASPEKTVIPRLWGELNLIYVDPAFQRRGAGTALFTTVANKLKAEGYKGLISWMLAGNPSWDFYRKMGGTAQGAKVETFGGVPRELVAFEWTFD
jgi:GNAT superfamily N-acetyltransferase